VPYAQTPDSEIDSEAHRELALKMARESIVLLKNDGVLPWRGRQEDCCLWASRQSVPVLEGNYNAHLRVRPRLWMESGSSLLRLKSPMLPE